MLGGPAGGRTGHVPGGRLRRPRPAAPPRRRRSAAARGRGSRSSPACLLVLGLAAFTTVQLLGDEWPRGAACRRWSGKTQAHANRLLAEASLVGEFSTAPSTPQQKGQVVSSDPAAGFAAQGGRHRHGDRRRRSGQPLAMPNVVGRRTTDAAAQLQDRRSCVPVRQDVQQRQRRRGQVLSHQPEAGRLAGHRRSARITVQVSNGRRRAARTWSARPTQEATAILNQAGWTSIERQVEIAAERPRGGHRVPDRPDRRDVRGQGRDGHALHRQGEADTAPTTPSPTGSPTSPSPSGSPTSTAG